MGENTSRRVRGWSGSWRRSGRRCWGLARVGVTENFFELGGDSILSLQVIARAEQAGLGVALRDLFQKQTIAQLCAGLVPAAAALPPIARVARGAQTVLSYAQRRLWFLWQLEPQSGAYNICGAVRLRGELNEVRTQEALSALVARHESLRTVFVQTQEGEGAQRVLPPFEVRLERSDLSGQGELQTEAAVRVALQEAAGEPFDLLSGPLLRVRLLRVREQEHVLLVTMHHIISDGWSLRVLIEEFGRLYAQGPEGAGLAPLPIQYADYALWQREWLAGGEGERQLGYWRGKLGSEHPVLELPTDRPRLAQASQRGGRYGFGVDERTTRQLRGLGQRLQASLFMVLLGGWGILLHRYTRQGRIRIGVPVANRRRVETEGVIGFFVNTQVLQLEVSGQQSVQGFLGEVREAVLEAQAHADLPFEQLVEALRPQRSLSHNPLFQVMYNHQRDGSCKGCRVWRDSRSRHWSLWGLTTTV